MRTSMLTLCAVLAGATLAVQEGQAADSKADGPDMQETMEWIRKYVNEEAGGQNYDSYKYSLDGEGISLAWWTAKRNNFAFGAAGSTTWIACWDMPKDPVIGLNVVCLLRGIGEFRSHVTFK